MIVEEAGRRLVLKRVVLFGSRARGDHRADSDLDLAFEHTSDNAAWADFTTRVQELAPTLIDIDLVDLNGMSAEMRARVINEGRVLYG